MQSHQSPQHSPYRALGLAALGLAVLPLVLSAIGLTPASATDVVIFAIAALGLNMLVGYTGLTSFGHGAFLAWVPTPWPCRKHIGLVASLWRHCCFAWFSRPCWRWQ